MNDNIKFSVQVPKLDNFMHLDATQVNIFKNANLNMANELELEMLSERGSLFLIDFDNNQLLLVDRVKENRYYYWTNKNDRSSTSFSYRRNILRSIKKFELEEVYFKVEVKQIGKCKQPFDSEFLCLQAKQIVEESNLV